MKIRYTFRDMETTAGYRELEHTADWALEFWAPNFTELLEQAARGMYSLAGAQGQDEDERPRVLISSTSFAAPLF